MLTRAPPHFSRKVGARTKVGRGTSITPQGCTDYGFSGQACRSGLRHHHRYSNKVNRQGFVRASGLLTSAFAIALLEGNIVT